jgi:hypothetical protein
MTLPRKLSVSLLSGMAALAVMTSALAAAPHGPETGKNVVVEIVHGADLLKGPGAATPLQVRSQQMSLTSYGPPVRMEFDNNMGDDQWGDRDHVPVWTYHVRNAGRDGLDHIGAIVGTNPFRDKRTSRVPVVIVPLIVTTHTVATGINLVSTNPPADGDADDSYNYIFTTTQGDVTQDSNAPDNNCLQAPNNVPSKLVYQSPLFQNAPFNFGGTYMGNTQYIDALQRAEFYQALGGDPDNYHVLFDPVRIISPVRVDVPANEGLAAPTGFFKGSGSGTCGPVQFLDINWFDSYINGTILPQLRAEGIGPGTIPVFFLYNTNLASPVTDLSACCILGYHSYAGEPTPSQVYAVAEMDVTGLFGGAIENTGVLSHELGELVNDPYTNNEVPPWGNIGQTAGCQENLEVGDPLTGTGVNPVTMKNGYTYQLQELAFFSWFFGGQSLGVNGWYSSGGTFTSDAGPVCGS